MNDDCLSVETLSLGKVVLSMNKLPERLVTLCDTTWVETGANVVMMELFDEASSTLLLFVKSKGLPGAKTDATQNKRQKISEKNP